jgi:hypothetical protein
VRYRWALVALCFAYLIVLFVIWSPVHSWVNPEVTGVFWPNTVRFSYEISSSDILQSLNAWDFDRTPRARFLSHFLQIMTARLRLALFDVVPPLPSLSLAWLFSICLTPMLLYSTVLRLTNRRDTAILAAALLLLSVGTLSTVSMLFHPAKALAMFFVVAAIRLAIAVGDAGSDPDARTRFLFLWLGLLGLAIIACFSDEKAWFVFAAAPLVVPAAFIRTGSPAGQVVSVTDWILRFRDIRWAAVVAWALAFLAFLSLLAFVVPALSTRIGLGGLPFFEYASPADVAPKFEFRNLLLNADALLRDVFSVSNIYSPANASKDLLARGWMLVVMLVLVWMLRSADRQGRLIALNFVVAAAAFICFHALIQARHATVQGTFYYGSVLAPLLAIPIAICLTASRHRFLSVSLFVVLVGSSLANFFDQNKWLRSNAHFGAVYQAFFPDEAKIMAASRLHTETLWTAWRARNDGERFERLVPSLPLEGLWLVQEMEVVRLKRDGWQVLRGRAASSNQPADVRYVVDLDERTGWPSPNSKSLIYQDFDEPKSLRTVKFRVGTKLERGFRILVRNSPTSEWRPIRVRIVQPLGSASANYLEQINLRDAPIPRMYLALECDPASLPPGGVTSWGIEFEAKQVSAESVFDMWAIGRARLAPLSES